MALKILTHRHGGHEEERFYKENKSPRENLSVFLASFLKIFLCALCVSVAEKESIWQ
jgi:hypothetical protein